MTWHRNGRVCLALLVSAATLTPAISGAAEDGTPADGRLEAFEQRALRFAPRSSPTQIYPYQWWARGISDESGFVVWTADYERLGRAAALREAGAEEQARQQELAVGLAEWSLPLSIGTLAGLVLVGGMVGAGVGATLPAESGAVREENITAGALLGVLVGDLLALVPAIGIPQLPRLFAVGEQEAADQVRAHNRDVAREVGLSEGEIPFEYLGY